MYDLLYSYLIDPSKTCTENIDRLIKYRGFDPITFKVSDYGEMLSYFSKDTIRNYEVTWLTRENRINKWTKSFASNRLRGSYISPGVLEPFIARYVIAINRIGIKTFYSYGG